MGFEVIKAVPAYHSEHQIVYMACQEAQGLWGFSEVTGPVEFPRGNSIQQGWRKAVVLFVSYPWGNSQS